MKRINIKMIGVFVMLVLILGSCKKWIDTDINKNPDAPQDAPLYAILSSAEATIGFNTVGGNDLCRVTAFWMQYFQGLDRQSLATSNYILQSQDVNNLWNTNYAGSMMDLKVIIDKSYALDQPWYRGVAQVLMANCLGITSDFWGSIPYTEAFQGSANLTPKFNSQEEIYNTIQQLLDSAVVNLQKEDPGYYDDIQGDMMYGGDLALWVKAAYAFKARYYLHLSKVDVDAYTKTLTALTNAISDNAEDLQQPFDDNSPNPLAYFMDLRGDLSMHAYFINLLNSRGPDPRLTVYAYPAADGTYYGNDFGGEDWDASAPGDAVRAYTTPVPLITNAECLFMKAECDFRLGDQDAARADLFAGLKASLDKQGVFSDLYYDAYVAYMTPVTGDSLIKEIMVQKYIALYYQAESFNDWRRTDNIIGLVPNPGPAAAREEIPRRYLYPTDEINYNPNTPVVQNIWERVWWDLQLGK